MGETTEIINKTEPRVEVEYIITKSEKFAKEDIKKKEEVEVMNQADTLIYATEKSLKEFGDKVSQSERADIEARLNDVKQAMKDKNVDSIKRGLEELTKASHKLAEEVYKKTSKTGAGQGGPAGGESRQGPQGAEPETEKEAKGKKKDEDIIDAEYTAEDEDDKKKGKR